MSEGYKIKDYTKKNKIFGGGPPPSIFKKILGVVLVVGLIFLGISLYKPVYNFVTGRTKPNLPPPVVEEETPPPVEEAEPEIKPEEPEPPAPEQLQGIYISQELLEDEQALEEYVKTLPKGINTLIIRGKTEDGLVHFQTTNENVNAWEGAGPALVDISKSVELLNKHQLQLGVELSIFSDPIAARGNIEQAILHSSGVIWIDNLRDQGGKPWVTPYSSSGQQYNLDLITELSQQGVGVILLNHVRLPRDPTESANVRGDGTPLLETLDGFVQKAQQAAGDSQLVLMVSESDAYTKGTGQTEKLYGGDPMTLSAPYFAIPLGTENLGASGATVPEGIDQEQLVWILPEKERSNVPNSPYILTS